jgi:TolB protein
VVLFSLALGVALAAAVALAGTAPQAQAASSEKIIFASNRTTGTGVNNPTGDTEIFKMNPDGTGLKQLTFNEVHDFDPELSTDGTRITYGSSGKQKSNPEGDDDVYVMNALDGTGKKNLSNNGADVNDYTPVFSPSGKRIAYTSDGAQPSNLEGDNEVYIMNALDGSGKKNLSDSADGVYDYYPAFSPDSTKIAYQSNGVQVSNPEGDYEVYVMNALDGSGKKNLSNNASSVDDLPADWGVQGI